MIHHGFLRVAAATPALRVADCAYNAAHVLALMRRAEGEGVGVLVFPDTFADYFERVPYPPASGLQTVLDQRADEIPAARGANPAAWIDDRFVRELEASGYIDRVYQCGGAAR